MEKAVGILGPVGRMVYGGKINYNARVTAGKLGRIWYGDLGVDEMGKLDALVVALGQSVEVTVEH